jgi:hypothetical protein
LGLLSTCWENQGLVGGDLHPGPPMPDGYRCWCAMEHGTSVGDAGVAAALEKHTILFATMRTPPPLNGQRNEYMKN